MKPSLYLISQDRQADAFKMWYWWQACQPKSWHRYPSVLKSYMN